MVAFHIVKCTPDPFGYTVKTSRPTLHFLNLKRAVSGLPVDDFICRVFISTMVLGFL